MTGQMFYKRDDGVMVPVGAPGPQGIQGVPGQPRQAAHISLGFAASNVPNSALQLDVGAMSPEMEDADGVVLYHVSAYGGYSTQNHDIWLGAYSDSIGAPNPPGYGYSVLGAKQLNVGAATWVPLSPVTLVVPCLVRRKPDFKVRIYYSGPNCYGVGFAFAQYFPGVPFNKAW